MNHNVSIIGYGFVGQAVHASLQTTSEVGNTINTTIFDKNKTEYLSLSEFRDTYITDIVFVCVNSPKNDYTNFHDVISHLKFINYDGVVVIKTTVPFSIIKSVQDTTNLKIVFNPEFLSENTYIEDALNQDFIVLGGDYELTKQIEDLYNCTKLVYNDLTFKHTSIKYASDFKYVRNLYGAYKVLFWNFVNERMGNARLMSDMMEHLPQGDMSQVGMDGELGFGGNCFIKDLHNYNNDDSHELMEFMINMNSNY